MKNLLKKGIATVLTLLMMFSCLSVQSFALFDKITDVKINSLEKFSYRMIKDELEFLEEMGGAEADEDYYYYLGCEADVTISTGEVIAVADTVGFSQDEKRIVTVYAYVDMRECREAYKSGKLKVPVHITVTLSSSVGIELDEKTVEKKISFPKKLVSKLTLVSGKIEVYSLDYYYMTGKIEGLCFDIVYGDGSKKRAKVEKVTSEEVGTVYTLDGEEIFIEPDYTLSKNGKLYATVYFYDCELRSTVKVKEFPIKKVKINSVTFDDEFNEKKITYTITKTDGEKYKNTYEFGKPWIELESLGMAMYNLPEFEGFSVTVSVLLSEGTEYPPQQFKEVIVSVEGVIDDVKSFDGPKEEGTKLGEILFKLVNFITGIFGTFIYF